MRISSPYGFRQENNTVLKKFILSVYAGDDIYYFGRGERTQNFVDVRDVSQAVVKCLNDSQNGIFNIASNCSVSMKDLADLVVDIGRNEFNAVSAVHRGEELDSEEDVRINIDISLAENVIGWKPQIELADGIRHWMKNI